MNKLLKILESIAISLYPIKTKYDLIRVGSDIDGGYLLPNDLEGISMCFSPGVSLNATFELDLVSRGIGSHLADYSVDRPPMNLSALSFTKKHLGCIDTDTQMTLDTWVSIYAKGAEDLLLQMDIEGSEYVTLLSSTPETLRRFRIIVVEIHFVDNWTSQFNLHLAKTFFDKLLTDFHVVHNHPNNACGLVNMGGFIAPRVFELTLLRKDRSPAMGYSKLLPHPLDRPNTKDVEEIALPFGWYKQ
jgi:hypothetical protein